MSVEQVELPALQALGDGASAAPAQRLAALAGVKAELSVRAGKALSTVGEVLSLKDGDVLKMDTALTEPFDILLGQTVIARGELVAVGDQFGIRIVQTAAVGS